MNLREQTREVEKKRRNWKEEIVLSDLFAHAR